MGTEEKYERQEIPAWAFGFHTVPPTTQHKSRMKQCSSSPYYFAVLVRASSMEEKARALGLFGQKTFETWVQDHALEFAVYFVQVITWNMPDRNSCAIQPLSVKWTTIKNLTSAYNLDLLLSTAYEVITCLACLMFSRILRFWFGCLYWSGSNHHSCLLVMAISVSPTIPCISTPLLNSWANSPKVPDTVRDLIEVYGAPEEYTKKIALIVPMEITDLDDFRETQKPFKLTMMLNKKLNKVRVSTKAGDVVLPEVTKDIRQALEVRAQKFDKRMLKNKAKTSPWTTLDAICG